MEEALVVNWLTRAFARILFQLDVTGMSRDESSEYLTQFMGQLRVREGGRGGIERLTVAKDLAIGQAYQNLGGKWEPGLNDVKVLDTSNTGFWNISAVEYWRTKLITATGVPKAHLGIEQDINAKATLMWQDERFSRTVRRVQMMMSEFIHGVIDLELWLHGIDPTTVSYIIEWPSPSMLDEESHSQSMLSYAQAAEKLIAAGVVSPRWVGANWLHIPPSVQQAIDSDNEKLRRAQETTNDQDGGQ
jgi:hypothetical protein